jgi:uncharacterized membrane protein YgcG
LNPVDLSNGKCLSDTSGLLSDSYQVSHVETVLADLNKKKSCRVAVFLVKNCRDLPAGSPETISFTHDLHAYAFPDSSAVDDGIVLAYFHDQHGVLVEVGKLVQPFLTDADVAALLKKMVPHLSSGRLFGALNVWTTALYKSLPNKYETVSGAPLGEGKSVDPESSWWKDFKAWFRAMRKGQRPAGATALFGIGVGAGIYYLWHGMVWMFWASVIGLSLRWLYKNVWVPRFSAKAAAAVPEVSVSAASVTSNPVSVPDSVVPQPSKPLDLKSSVQSSGNAAPNPSPVQQVIKVIINEDSRWPSQGGFWSEMNTSNPSKPNPGVRASTETTAPPVETPKPDLKPPKAATEVPGVVKAAAVGAGAAVLNRDFQIFRQEEQEKRDKEAATRQAAAEEQDQARQQRLERAAAAAQQSKDSETRSSGGASWSPFGSSSSSSSSSSSDRSSGGSSWGSSSGRSSGGSSWGSSSSSSPSSGSSSSGRSSGGATW